jgi:hypothetical protein
MYQGIADDVLRWCSFMVFNPEIDQGLGLANSLGVAGFTSGAAYKAGANYPYTRLAQGRHDAFDRRQSGKIPGCSPGTR